MKHVLWVLILMVFLGTLSAQKIVYVSPDGSDNWSGASALPYQTVHKALEAVKGVTGAVEIRVAVGKYLISSRKGNKKGELVIPANVTVRGAYVKESSGVKDVLSPDRGNPAGQTLFQGDSTCRIATLKGVLEQVVVDGGRADGANGGGVLVESGGKVLNCIIRNNQASGSMPKVGDILLESGDFIDVTQYIYGQADKVKGVVFWVNPKRDAPVGDRARAVSIKEFTANWIEIKSCRYEEEFIPNLVLTPYCVDIEAAILDTDGAENTEKLLSNTNAYVTNFPLAKVCRDYGAGWYLPAIGEIMWILAEWGVVDDTFRILWTKIQDGCKSDVNTMKSYFGFADPSFAARSWYEAGLSWFNGWPTSSSRSDAVNCWQLTGFYNEAALSKYLIASNRKGTASATNAPQKTFAVKRF